MIRRLIFEGAIMKSKATREKKKRGKKRSIGAQSLLYCEHTPDYCEEDNATLLMLSWKTVFDW